MKTILIILSVAILVFASLFFYQLGQNAPLGGGYIGDVNYYNSATSTAVACNGATSTLLTASASRQGARAAFELTVSSSSITLCKRSAGCVQNQGIFLASTTGYYYQTDAYYGPYSCIGNFNTTSTVGVTIKQN